MDRDTYISFYNRIEGTGYQKALKICDKMSVALTAVAYVLLLFYYFMTEDDRLVLTIVIPAAEFIALSVIRAALNLPRPYEVWGTRPLISKDTCGKSCPSRHVFSIFLIASVFVQFNVAMGLVIIAMGIELAVIRVLTGVHFERDVLWGAISGLLGGLIYSIILLLA